MRDVLAKMLGRVKEGKTLDFLHDAGRLISMGYYEELEDRGCHQVLCAAKILSVPTKRNLMQRLNFRRRAPKYPAHARYDYEGF